MGELIILQLLGIRVTNTLSFMPQLRLVLSLLPKYTDDLKQAGAHSTGLETEPQCPSGKSFSPHFSITT